jgi:hypothetical protein
MGKKFQEIIKERKNPQCFKFWCIEMLEYTFPGNTPDFVEILKKNLVLGISRKRQIGKWDERFNDVFQNISC